MARAQDRLFGPAQVSNAAATKVTAGAAEKLVMRHIHVSNPSGSIVTFTMSIGADAAATRIFDAYPIPASTAVDFFGMYVVQAGEVVQAFAGTNNILTLECSGDRLTLG
jgi:hypothetical protein